MWYLTMEGGAPTERWIGCIRDVPIDSILDEIRQDPLGLGGFGKRGLGGAKQTGKVSVRLDAALPAANQIRHAYARKLFFRSATISWGNVAVPTYSVQFDNVSITQMNLVQGKHGLAPGGANLELHIAFAGITSRGAPPPGLKHYP